MMRFAYILSAAVLALFSIGCEPLVAPEGEDEPETGQNPGQNPEQGPEDVTDPEETGEFMIIAWSDIVDAFNSEWKLQKLIDADFNIYLGWYDSYDNLSFSISYTYNS